MENPFSGLAKAAPGRRNPRLAFQRLGHQRPQLVVKTDVPKEDIDDGLQICPIGHIFASPTTFIVFGNPNVALVTHNEPYDRWDRLAAYMFWRKDTHVIDTKGRIQAGVLCELRGISLEARDQLYQAMLHLEGSRTPSCAHSVALALHHAGFRTASGTQLRWIYRNSHLGAVLWGNGLLYEGQPVELRWIVPGKRAHDNFKAAWLREYKSLPRFVSKLLNKGNHTPAPVFEPNDNILDAADGWPETGPRVRISINVPSAFGVNLSYLHRVGPQPEYSIELPRPIEHEMLQRPLKPFDRKLDFMSFVKSKVLFSPLTCWLMAKVLEKEVATTEFIPVEVVARMLTTAPAHSCLNPDPIYKYNFVLTQTTLKVKRLRNNDGTENKFLAWMLAKHVLLSRWAKNVLAAGELWVCEDNRGRFIFINGESGSYQPTYAQITALSMELSKMFDLPVYVGDRPTS